MSTWTTPKTFSDDDTLPASDLNTYVSDNTQYLYDEIVALQNTLDSYILVRDEKTSGTDGGTFTSGAWQTRDLNTKYYDNQGNVAVSSNQVTLEAGTYYFRASAPSFKVLANVLRFRNITDGTTVITGTASVSHSVDSTQTRAFVEGRFTIPSQKTFELQHYCNTSRSTDGFGVASNIDTEIYSVLELWRLY